MSEQCQNPGAYKYTWPGRNEAHICELHVVKLRSVANAMGLYIQIRAVPEGERWQCDQKVSAEKRKSEETK